MRSEGNNEALWRGIYQETIEMLKLHDLDRDRKSVLGNQLLMDCRYKVCEAYVRGGPETSLAALAAQSIRLCHHVDNGDLCDRPAFRTLLQVACNLRLPQQLGKPAVRAAVHAGPIFYDSLAVAA